MLGVPPALANTKFPAASSDVIGRDPPDAKACIVASVLLLIRAGLIALPNVPGLRLNKAPPAANCEDAINPGLRPAAAAMAAKLLAGNCAAPCSAVAAAGWIPDVVTTTWPELMAEVMGVGAVWVVPVSLALDASVTPAEAEGEGLRDGDVRTEDTGGAVDITVAVLAVGVPVVPVAEKLVTAAALVNGSTGFTVNVVAALLVTRLGVEATKGVGLGNIALMGELLDIPLLGGLILFSF